MMKRYSGLIVLFLLVKSACAQQLSGKLDEAISTYVRQEKFTGTVLIASHGRIILNKGYGLRDAAAGAPNTPATVYELASIAKTFTAAVILKLREQGKLALSDPLSKYDPGYPNGAQITIAELLSHTAGIYDYVRDPEFQQSDQSKPVPLEAMIGIFKNKPLNFEPGTKFSYSNSGYTLLGYIIEQITGKPYRQVLDELIIQPLGLTHTGYDFPSLVDSNKATGYQVYAAGNYQPAILVDPSVLYTTGALYSTAGDLYKWHQALQGDRFLTAAVKKEMYTPAKGPYGYGWFADSLFGRKRVSHDGNVAGFKTNINRFPDDDLCVIALSNSSSSRVGEIVRVLVSILCDQPYQLPVERKSIRVSNATLETYCGTYQFGPQTTLIISLENSRLFVQGKGVPKTELFAESPVSFFGRTMEVKVEFSPGEINFYPGKQKFTGKKIN